MPTPSPAATIPSARQEAATAPIAVGGRLASFKEEWFLFTEDPFARSVVAEGVKIELTDQPQQDRLPRRHYAPEEEEAIAREIKEMCEKSIAVVLPFFQDRPQQRTFVSDYFTVPKPNGTRRSILNLAEFNLNVRKRYFKLESLRTALELLRGGDFMVKVDIKDAYFHVPVHKAFQPFLRFNFRGKTYQFICLPMGLTSSPRLFTRLMKPIVAHLRDRGVRLVIYLDDILIIAESRTTVADARDYTLALLRRLGWVINEKKSLLEPAQVMEFLGFRLDSQRMLVSLPMAKCGDLANSVNELLEKNAKSTLTLREAAATLGKMSATAMAVEPARLRERPLLDQVRSALARASRWEDPVSLPTEVVEACRWWIDSLRLWNGRSIIPRSVEATLRSGASAVALGAVIEMGGQYFRCQRPLTPEEFGWTSNRRELRAIVEAIKHYGDLLRGKMVLLRSDNSASVACVNLQGSRIQWLNAAANELWEFCLRRRIGLRAEHIPGVENGEADRLSRWMVIDSAGGYQLNPAIFIQIQQRWGPFSVDLFASSVNRLLPRFFSWIFDPEAEALDAFRQRWPDKSWAHPPVSLLQRVLVSLPRLAEGEITLVVPHWPSRPWWALLRRYALEGPINLAEYNLPILLPSGGVSPPEQADRWALQRRFLRVGPRGQETPTTRSGNCFESGARTGTLIPYGRARACS